MLVDVRTQTREELALQFEAWGLPTYRLDQLLSWLYIHRVVAWDEMKNLPRDLREKLQATYHLRPLQLARLQGARDTTQKFLWKLHDNSLVESVLIPANPALYGEASDRHTLCVSTQVGCAYGCKFCASGLDGWKRNLHPDEIVEQVLAVERWHARQPAGATEDPTLPGAAARPRAAARSPGLPAASAPATSGPPPSPGERPTAGTDTRRVNNLVIMGMGEPLANYANLLQALRILNAPWGGGIGARKITISTSGLVPQIRKLAEEPLQFRLALSLHGATDETRNKIMPVNRKYPLYDLIGACEYYVQRKGHMITLEYILISGVNDAVREVHPLAALARRLHAKINLIPYNRVEGLAWDRPTEATQEAFRAALEAEQVPVTLRREKGHDIDAACGQLRLKTERELAFPGHRC